MANYLEQAPQVQSAPLTPSENDFGGSFMNFLKSPQALALGAGLLQAGGHSEQPISFGQALSHGILQMQQATNQDIENQMRKAAVQEFADKAKEKERKLQAQQSYKELLGEKGGWKGGPFLPTEGRGLLGGQVTPEEFKYKASGLLFDMGEPTSALSLLTQKKDDGFTLKPGEARYDASGKVIAGSMDAVDPKDQFDNATKLRSEYIGQSKDFKGISDSYGRIQAAGATPSAAGDMALVYNFMKMLDPGSTVREGEFANAQNSAGVPDRTRAAYNSIINGQRLSEQQRADFLGRSSMLYDSASQSQQQVDDQYKALAERNNLNPENVIVNYRVKGRDSKKYDALEKQAQDAIAAGAHPEHVKQRLQQMRGGG